MNTLLRLCFMQRLLHVRFARFLAVGMLNAAFGYGCFALLLYAGLHYTVALLAATVAGILFNFKTTGRLVFQSSDNRLILRFFLMYAVVYLINAGGIKIFVALGISPYHAAAALILPMAALAYLFNKRFVFNND